MTLFDRFYDKYVWELKFRPNTFEDIVLPPRFRKFFEKEENIKNPGNLLMYGPHGTGKTTIAFLIAELSGSDYKYIPMSLDTGIANIRDDLIKFIGAVGFSEGKKIVIGDEFDRLSGAAMDSLKTVIEEYSKHVNFIFITNSREKVIPPGISRLCEMDFNYTAEEAKAMKKEYWKRVCRLLADDEIKFDPKAVAEVIKFQFPDMRKVWNFLQLLYKTDGKITNQNIRKKVVDEVLEFFKYIKEKDYFAIRKFIMNNDYDIDSFYSFMWKLLDKVIDKKSLPAAIVLLARWQKDSTNSVDKQIPLAACAVELSNDCKFK